MYFDCVFSYTISFNLILFNHIVNMFQFTVLYCVTYMQTLCLYHPQLF